MKQKPVSKRGMLEYAIPDVFKFLDLFEKGYKNVQLKERDVFHSIYAN